MRSFWLGFAIFAVAFAMNTTVSRANFVQTNIISDIPGEALLTDSSLKNPWGMSFSATSPIWVSDAANGTGTASLFNALTPSVQSLLVSVPGGPTGQVFNSTPSNFQIPAASGTVKAAFLFDTLSGTIQGWNPGSTGGANASVTVATVQGAAFTGLALGSSGGANYLYSANANGGIVVFDGTFANVTGTIFAGKFVDPNPVAGFTPYNIQILGGNLFVTYASPSLTPGGYVDEFDTAGNFIKRIATNGPLNAPWGLAIAPAGFGTFGGDLLVGNLLDSVIAAINLGSDTVDGLITVNTGVASSVGLWALDFGNGASGDPNTLYFTAGINDQQDGLLGAITAVPEPASLLLFSTAIVGFGAFRQWRRKGG